MLSYEHDRERECRVGVEGVRDGAVLSHGPCAVRDETDASRITCAVGATLAKASDIRLPGHLLKHPATATTTAVMLEAMRMRGALVCGSKSWARAGDLLGKLVVLPFVGVSLCGAVTLVLGVQWVEMLQQRRPQSVRLWGALLALLLLLVPSRPLLASPSAEKPQDALEDTASTTEEEDEEDEEDEAKHVEPGYSALLSNGGKRGGHDSSDADADADDTSYAYRPYKRQRSGDNPNDDGSVPASSSASNDGSSESNDTSRASEEGEHREETKTKIKIKARAIVRRRRVFIWDLDETLVLFASLYTGTFAQTHGKEVAPGVALGEQMMTFLLAMLERHFFFSQLHNADVDHIARVAAMSTTASSPSAAGSGSSPTDQRLPLDFADQYARIREIYERRGHVDFLHDSGSEWFAIRRALIAAIDSFSMGWLHEARQVLELITTPGPMVAHSETQYHGEETPVHSDESGRHHDNAGDGTQGSQETTQDDNATEKTESEEPDEEEGEEVMENVNVLVTNTQLVPALCKCLIYQLDTFFPIERVYSSAKVHKYRCFETIMAKYQAPGVEFVAIGDGLEEEQVSLALGLEFHKIRSLMDLKRLRYDLQLVRRYNPAASSPAGSTASSTPTASTMPVTSPVGQAAAV